MFGELNIFSDEYKKQNKPKAVFLSYHNSYSARNIYLKIFLSITSENLGKETFGTFLSFLSSTYAFDCKMCLLFKSRLFFFDSRF